MVPPGKFLLVPHMQEEMNKKNKLAVHTEQLLPPPYCQFPLSTMEANIDAQVNIMQY
jgi:hypothetical protein